tara:strand:- start:147 stop:305 length:159 start_codon:yes stop_codon:yes gene_type:complete
VIKGWDVGLLEFKLGERANLEITPAWAYGAGGSPPGISLFNSTTNTHGAIYI